ncbi:MAG TPA: hypothetical protein VKV74_16850 [Bryobacteraceae bacterium]|nr:hypothetical protein [Bryobacteraceae bacterium]
MRTCARLACVAVAVSAALWAQPPAGGTGRGKARGNNRPPSRPTPHWPDGHVNLGPLPGEKGVWEGNAGSTLATNPPGGLDNPNMYLPTNLKISEVPFLPWAKAVYDYRQSSTTKDDPHVRCKPSGGSRMFHTPYGFEFLDLPDQQRIYIVGVGGPHTWRVVYMDRRPRPDDLDPSFAGYSVGRWDGDALVVDTVGFNEKFWLTREGIPLTENLHLTERFTRTDYDDLKYEATIDDPGAYSRPWTGGWWIRWQPNQELYEYVCQDNNRDVRHMYGGPRN